MRTAIPRTVTVRTGRSNDPVCQVGLVAYQSRRVITLNSGPKTID
jgi:hypothetical protein